MKKFLFLTSIILLFIYGQAQEFENTSPSYSFSIKKKAVAVEKPHIIWRSPTQNNQTTSFSSFNVEACIKSQSTIKEVKIYHNNSLINSKLFQPVEFRGDCDFSVNEQIELKNGENLIGIEVVTESDNIKSEMTVKYNFATVKYYALIIGIQDYEDDNINDLSEPVKDAQKLYDILTTQYTFEKQDVTLLKNATRTNVIDALDVLNNKVTENDNLLIFYAGHGYWDPDKETGYWLPSDAQKGKTANWLRNSTIQGYLDDINTKHTLLIADACFGGGIFKTRSAFSDIPEGIERIYALPSRKAMTSGMLNEVPDKSVFLEYLTKRLEQNEDAYLSSLELFIRFRSAVLSNSKNTPQYGTIQNCGDEGGDFIFIKRK